MGRAKLKPRRRLAGALVLLLAVAVAVPFMVPLARFIPQISHFASNALGQPVAIAGLRLQLLPVPAVRIAGLHIGRHDEIAIARVSARPELLPLLAGRKVIDEISADRVRVKPGALRMFEHLPKSSGGEPVLVRRIVLRDVKYGSWPSFDLDVLLGPQLAVDRALLRTRGGALRVALEPESAQAARVQLRATRWRLPLASAPLIIDALQAHGVLRRDRLELPRIDARLYGGTLDATSRLDWGRDWRLRGKAKLAGIELAPLERALGKPAKLTGRLSGEPSWSARARSARGLGRALRLEAPFRVVDGAYHGVDLKRAVELPIGKLTPGGGTRFQRLKGKLVLRGADVRVDPLCAKSSVLTAAGHVTIAPDRRLSGKLDVAIERTQGTIGVPLALGGTTSDPSVTLTRGGMIGAVLGTVLLPGAGTTLGASVGGFFEGHPECK